MVRISKQEERRMKCPRKRRSPSPKTGPKKDALEYGYRVHVNALPESENVRVFISKVK